jgi:hypothetical protein
VCYVHSQIQKPLLHKGERWFSLAPLHFLR